MSQSGADRSRPAGGCGPVEIKLPADPGLVSVMRLTASGMAATARCTVDEIDDIKLAVSEVLLVLIEHAAATSITLRLELRDGMLGIEGCAVTSAVDLDHPDLALSKTVLAEVSATHSIDLIGSEMRISATVRLDRAHAC